MKNRIDEIYKYCSEENVPMLSSYDSDFWEVYIENYQYFDKLFMKTYRKFVAFSSDEDTVEENATDWISDVYSWLIANDKRYSELWRMQELENTDYSMLEPYNVTESHSSSASKSGSDSMGAKTDTKSSTLNYGATSASDDNSYTHGARSESDSESLSYGRDVTSTDTDSIIGSQDNTNENKVSAFNDGDYSPKDYQEQNLGTREDTISVVETRDSRSDSKTGSHTEQTYTDSESKTRETEAHTDSVSDTNIYGAHTNTHTGTESETKSVTKKGNLGVFSPAKLLGEHVELWSAYSFYKLIFDEIAEQFLRIVYF